MTNDVPWWQTRTGHPHGPSRALTPASERGQRTRPNYNRRRSSDGTAPTREPMGAPGNAGPSGAAGQAPMTGAPGAGNTEQDILRGLGLGGPGEEQDPVEPIGGYFFTTPENAAAQRLSRGQGSTFQGYYEGDEWELLAGIPEEQILRLQEQMMDLGLISSATPGVLDDATVNGFKHLLAMANRRGSDWQTVLRDVRRTAEQNGWMDEETGQVEESAPTHLFEPGFVAPVRLEADPVRLAEDVRSFAEDRLGRELEDGEVEHLVGALRDIERDDFGRMVDAERSQFDASQDANRQPDAMFRDPLGTAEDTVASERWARGNPTGPGQPDVIRHEGEDQAPEGEEYGAGVVASRFSDYFRDRYQPEMDRQGRVEVGQAVSNLLSGSFDRVAQMSGGR